MRDQAQNLRNKIKSQMQNQIISNFQGKSRVFSITSGKGGVGKTNISVNLSIALRKIGFEVIIIDADLGLSNVEVLLGTIPKLTFRDMIYGDMDINSIIEKGPYGINFISGGSGFLDLVDLEKDSLMKLVESLFIIDQNFDTVIVDTGAGISRNVLQFALSSDEVIVITTPEPTAITDAYALIKAIFSREKTKKINLVVNKVAYEKQALEVYSRLNTVIKKFLKNDINYLGYLEDNDIISKAVIEQVPFIVSNERSAPSRQIYEIAKKLVHFEDTNGGLNGIRKLLNIILNK